MKSVALLFTLFTPVLLVITLETAQAQTRIVDGDTIEHNGISYRLHGIDAPEAGQKCNKARSGTWPCGKAAIAAIEAIVFNNKLECDNRGTDDYGRVIAVCTANGIEINSSLVRQGMAWAFTKFSDDYLGVEKKAQAEKIGVWQAPTQTAWDFRAERWEVGQQQAPEGCPIKGNISRNGQIYHAPWSPWYNRTKVSLEKGEKWFCNEAEAIAAGWRAPYWGK